MELVFNITDKNNLFCYTEADNYQEILSDILDCNPTIVSFGEGAISIESIYNELENRVFSTDEHSLVADLKKYNAGKKCVITMGDSSFEIYPINDDKECLQDVVFTRFVIEAFLSEFVIKNYIELVCCHQEKYVGLSQKDCKTYDFDTDGKFSTDFCYTLKLRPDDKERLTEALKEMGNSLNSDFMSYNPVSLLSPDMKFLFSDYQDKIKQEKMESLPRFHYYGYDYLLNPTSDTDSPLLYVLEDDEIAKKEEILRLYDKGSFFRKHSEIDAIRYILADKDLVYACIGGIFVFDKIFEPELDDILSDFRDEFGFVFNITNYPPLLSLESIKKGFVLEFEAFGLYCSPKRYGEVIRKAIYELQ